MAETMLERAVDALFAEYGQARSAASDGELLDIRRGVRAVIASLREPSEAVERAGYSTANDMGAASIFNAMIDAILEEPKA